MIKTMWNSMAEVPIPLRFAIAGTVIFGVIGGVVGLIIGLNVYAPTAWFAVFEIGLPAGILGAVVGLAIGGIAQIFRR